jgi:hypothetical protein
MVAAEGEVELPHPANKATHNTMLVDNNDRLIIAQSFLLKSLASTESREHFNDISDLTTLDRSHLTPT